MTFDGTNWVNMGDPGFSKGEAVYTNLACSPSDGQPYVAYEDYGNAYKATLMKYDSVYVGIEKTKNLRFSIYPNPATDKILLEMPALPEACTLVIENITGKEVIKKSITEPQVQIDLTGLSRGVYFVKIKGQQIQYIEKIIKD